MFEITLDLSDTEIAALNLLNAQEGLFKKAASRALTQTARWLRTLLTQEVANELNLNVRLVRPGVVVIGARQSSLRSQIGLSAKSGVIKARDLGKAQQNSTGVKAGKRQYDHAFKATMPNGHKGVFQRTGKSSLTIREQTIVFTGRLAEQLEIANDGLARQQLKKIFEREYRHLARQN